MTLNNFTGDGDDNEPDDGNAQAGADGASPDNPLVNPPPPPGPPGGFGSMMSFMTGRDSGGKDDPREFLVNYNKVTAGNDPIMFREQPLAQIVATLLGKKKPNPLLLGSNGVGKSALAEELARLITLEHPSIPPQLHGHTIWGLSLSALVAGTMFRGQLESRIDGLIAWVSDARNKAILFIDEIHVIAGEGAQESYGAVAQSLKPALARGDLRLIGATTLQEAKAFDQDTALRRRFTNVLVDELTPAQTITVVEQIKGSYERHYNSEVLVPSTVLPTLTSLADEFNRATNHRPDNALTLMDRAMSEAVVQHHTSIAKAEADGDDTLADILRSRGALILSETMIRGTAHRMMTGHASKPAIDLDLFAQRLEVIKGQENALARVTDAIAREDLSLVPRTTPLTMMFPGASGVGKTATARIISEVVTSEAPIILNMAEFNTEMSMTRIIGSGAGYVGSNSNRPLPFDELETNPYRVIVLDEFEKSDKAIQRLFLSVFDSGYMETALGKRIDFSKAIIIMTTNAARDKIGRPAMGFSMETPAQTYDNVAKHLMEVFEAELLGRINHLIPFRSLSVDIYREIIRATYVARLAEIRTRRAGLVQHLPNELSDDDTETIVASSYQEALGARPALQSVQEHIENQVLLHRKAQKVALQHARTSKNALQLTDTTPVESEPQTPEV